MERPPQKQTKKLENKEQISQQQFNIESRNPTSYLSLLPDDIKKSVSEYIPLEFDKSVKISEQELAKEGHRPESYLSLLPADIRKGVAQKIFLTNFEKLDLAIAAIKESQANDNRLLHDVAYNQEIVTRLSKNYDIPELEVALMLNTPASLELFKSRPLRARRDNGTEYDDYSSHDKIIYVIAEHLEKMLLDKSNPNLHQKADNAIRYVKRFLSHPLVQEKQVFNKDGYSFYYGILIPIDSIERGLDTIKDRHDGYQDGNAWYRNANITQEYLDIAIRFAHPIAAQTIINYMYRHDDDTYTYTMQKTLAQAFKNKNQQAVNFILDVFVKAIENKMFRISKYTFEKHDNRFERYGDRYKIQYQEFIDSIIAYIQTTGDYGVLDKLKKIMVAEDVKGIVTLLFIYNINQKTLTKELLAQFISLGVDVNEPDKNGEYPLIKAIKGKSSTMVAVLLAADNINVHICQEGYNPIWYAQNVDMDAATRTAIIDLLKQAGATQEGVCVIQ